MNELNYSFLHFFQNQESKDVYVCLINMSEIIVLIIEDHYSLSESFIILHKPFYKLSLVSESLKVPILTVVAAYVKD
jgi:hypothetical protein